MAITNTEVIKFSNEVVRPFCEEVRAMKAEIDSATTTWFNNISNGCPNDPEEILEDGRDVDGVSIITGADITNVISAMINLQTVLNAPGVVDVISKPCVKPLSAD